MPPTDRSFHLRLLAAFAAVYFIWGSTYLAIRIAIETIPPFLVAGGRSVVAGVVLLVWARGRGSGRVTLIHWRSAVIIGGLMLLGGNGAVTWSEQIVPSGLAALIVASVSLWTVLLDALRPGGQRLTAKTIAGVAVGLTGIGILVGPGAFTAVAAVKPFGALVLILGSLSWAIGSLYSLNAPLPAGRLLATAMELLCGGGLLVLVSGISGEWHGFSFCAVSAPSALAWLYLTVAGSLLGFTAYIWLLGHTTPARASTYSYVNPIVAVLLGWLVVDEPLTWRIALAGAVIVAGVALIISARAKKA